MRRRRLICAAVIAPTPAAAHDAFGDLGPFYASFLHPLADPMQAALVLGTAAFLAGRPVDVARIALPVFMGAAALAPLLPGLGRAIVPSPLLMAVALVAIGFAALLPGRWTPRWITVPPVVVTGTLAGLAPGPLPPGAMLQPLVGGALGIAVMTILAWAALDALARRVSSLAPAVAGSWVVALGLLAGAFAFAPPEVGAGVSTQAETSATAFPETSDR